MSRTYIDRSNIKEKPTPVNDDYFFINDSESGNMIRYILWSDIVTLLSSSGTGLTQQQVEGLI